MKNKKLMNNSKAKRPDELILEVDCRNNKSNRDDDTIRFNIFYYLSIQLLIKVFLISKFLKLFTFIYSSHFVLN